MDNGTFHPMKVLPHVTTRLLQLTAGMLVAASVARAEEREVSVSTAVSSTALSGFIDTSAIWHSGGGSLQPVVDFPGAGLPAVPPDVIGVRVQQLTDFGMILVSPPPLPQIPAPSLDGSLVTISSGTDILQPSAPAVPEASTVSLAVVGVMAAAFCFRARSARRTGIRR